jgi:hypothetical protein
MDGSVELRSRFAALIELEESGEFALWVRIWQPG